MASATRRLVPSLVLLMLSTSLALADTPADSGKSEDSWETWHLRFGVSFVIPELDFVDIDVNGPGFMSDSDDSTGLGVSLERRLNRRWGVELGLLTADSEVDFETIPLPNVPLRSEVDFRYTALSVGFDFHLTPDSRVDLYVGPLLTYARYDDVFLRIISGDQSLSGDLEEDDDFALGGQIGLDIPFGDRAWGLNLALRYMKTSLTLRDLGEADGSKVDFDPLILHAGLGYRF